MRIERVALKGLIVLCFFASSCASLRARREAKLPGDLCHTRLPEARAQLGHLYEEMQRSPAMTHYRREVEIVGDEPFEVKIDRDMLGALDVRGTQTGLSDLVVTCTSRRCALRGWLDGEVIPRRSEDKIELRCMRAGVHQLLLEVDGEVLFDGVLDMPSDHELALRVERYRESEAMEANAVRIHEKMLTFLPERIPPIPVLVDRGLLQQGGVLAGVYAPQAMNVAIIAAQIEATSQARIWFARSQAAARLASARADAAMVVVMTEPERSPPMKQKAFRALVRDVKRQKYEQGRKEMVELVAQQNLFSCEQAANLIETFKYGDDQADVAITLYPRLTDPEHLSKMLDAIKYKRDRERVKKALDL